MFRRADRSGVDRELALLDDAVGDFFDHLLKQHSQMRVRPIFGRRDVFHAIGMS